MPELNRTFSFSSSNYMRHRLLIGGTAGQLSLIESLVVGFAGLRLEDEEDQLALLYADNGPDADLIMDEWVPVPGKDSRRIIKRRFADLATTRLDDQSLGSFEFTHSAYRYYGFKMSWAEVDPFQVAENFETAGLLFLAMGIIPLRPELAGVEYMHAAHID